MVGLTSRVSFALADPSPELERVRLSYSAPRECPTAAEFEAQVAARLSLPWRAREGELARTIQISVDREGGAWKAILQYRGSGTVDAKRRVDGTTCADTIAVMAFVTAMVIEWHFDENPQKIWENAAVPTSSAHYVVTPTKTKEAAQKEPQVESKLGLVLRSLKLTDPANAGSSNAGSSNAPLTRSRLELVVGPTMLSGMGSRVALGATVLSGLLVGSQRIRFGVAAYQSSYGTTDIDGFLMRVRAVTAKLEHCPYVVAIGAAIRLPLCYGIESGMLLTTGKADGDIGINGRSKSDLWVQAQLAPKLRLDGAPWFVELGPLLVVPLSRREFVVARGGAGNELAHRTSQLAWGAETYVGMQFE